MQTFTYVIKDELGIHARPAGLLSKEARKYKSTISVVKGEKEVNVLKLMALMQLAVKCGETVTIKVDGEDEDVCAAAMEEFFKASF